MSERYAKSCAGKKRHRSERKAAEIAKRTASKFGVAMNPYPCDICKAWHVGTTRSQEAHEARLLKERDEHSDGSA